MGTGGDGDIGAGVNQEPGWARCCGDGKEDLTGERRDPGGGQIFFAKLDEVDAVGDPASGFPEEGGLLLSLVARIEGATGDGAAKHDASKCMLSKPGGRALDVGVVVSKQRGECAQHLKTGPHRPWCLGR